MGRRSPDKGAPKVMKYRLQPFTRLWSEGSYGILDDLAWRQANVWNAVVKGWWDYNRQLIVAAAAENPEIRELDETVCRLCDEIWMKTDEIMEHRMHFGRSRSGAVDLSARIAEDVLQATRDERNVLFGEKRKAKKERDKAISSWVKTARKRFLDECEDEEYIRLAMKAERSKEVKATDYYHRKGDANRRLREVGPSWLVDYDPYKAGSPLGLLDSGDLSDIVERFKATLKKMYEGEGREPKTKRIWDGEGGREDVFDVVFTRRFQKNGNQGIEPPLFSEVMERGSAAGDMRRGFFEILPDLPGYERCPALWNPSPRQVMQREKLDRSRMVAFRVAGPKKEGLSARLVFRMVVDRMPEFDGRVSVIRLKREKMVGGPWRWSVHFTVDTEPVAPAEDCGARVFVPMSIDKGPGLCAGFVDGDGLAGPYGVWLPGPGCSEPDFMGAKRSVMVRQAWIDENRTRAKAGDGKARAVVSREERRLSGMRLDFYRKVAHRMTEGIGEIVLPKKGGAPKKKIHKLSTNAVSRGVNEAKRLIANRTLVSQLELMAEKKGVRIRWASESECFEIAEEIENGRKKLVGNNR